MALDCLDTLVGLADRDCPCVSGSRPSGWNDSTTGRYLDDWEYGFPINASMYANTGCGEDSVWDALADARTKGIRDVKQDLQQALRATREDRIHNWNGLVGKAESGSNYSSTRTNVGLQLRPVYRLRDAYFNVTAIHLGYTAAETVSVTISSNDSTFTDVSEDIVVASDGWTRHTLSGSGVALPLYSISVSDLRYNVSYQPGAGVPKVNKIWCCARPPWLDHMDVFGFEADTLSDTIDAKSNYGYGIALEGYLSCNRLDWICNLQEMNGLDFRDLIGRCIQVKAAIKLYTRLIEGDKVNRFTAMDVEQAAHKRASLAELYHNDINWIAQNLPVNLSACWGCDKHAPKVTEILI